MNAYELAEIMEVHDGSQVWEHGLEIANMLRQQADRIKTFEDIVDTDTKTISGLYLKIAELEKESANLEHSLKNALIFIDNHKQTKPLSDEEIEGYEYLIAKVFNASTQQKVIGLDRIIRAIEAKVRGEK